MHFLIGELKSRVNDRCTFPISIQQTCDPPCRSASVLVPCSADAISKLPVGHQRLRTIYRDVTREPFRLHPFSPLSAGKLFQFVPVSQLLAPREFAWLLILLQTFISRSHIRRKGSQVWMWLMIFVTSQLIVLLAIPLFLQIG